MVLPDAQAITVNVLHGSVYAMGLHMLGGNVGAAMWEGGAGGGGIQYMRCPLLRNGSCKTGPSSGC